MAGRIPQHFIDELISRTDIVELINVRVPLKKAGKNHTACCPFHNEKSPSFNVSQQKQFYHCFGCGANGNAISFLMEYDRLDFLEAVEMLAQANGLEIPREGGISAPRGPDHKPLYAVMEKASAFYQQQLRQAPVAIEYLRNRKISGETAKRFGIGYAPAGWENISLAVDAAGGQQKNLLTAGMLIEREENSSQKSAGYDRFRDRVMFPIRDARGRTIAFGGRVLGDEKPKYLNSPETPIFHKGKELYGLYELKQTSESPDHILVVEGYMDVVALAEAGINNSVATLGTATSADHCQRLYRSFGEIVFCFDGDNAGRKAAWRALETVVPLMQQGRQARFLFLPDGEDPDSLVQSIGAEAFRGTVKTALPLSTYLLDSLAEQCDMNSLDGRAKFAELAKPYMQKIPAGVFRDMLNTEVADRANIQQMQVGVARPVKSTPVNAPVKIKTDRNRQISTALRAVILLINKPALGQFAPPASEFETIQDDYQPLLMGVLKYCQQYPNASSAQIAEQWRQTPFSETVIRALMQSIELDEAAQVKEFNDCMDRLLEKNQSNRLDELLNLSRLQTLTAEQKQELQALLQK